MEKNNIISISGLIIGGIAGGPVGAVIGGVIGSVIQEFLKCPKCGGQMVWQNLTKEHVCLFCGYSKR